MLNVTSPVATVHTKTYSYIEHLVSSGYLGNNDVVEAVQPIFLHSASSRNIPGLIMICAVHNVLPLLIATTKILEQALDPKISEPGKWGSGYEVWHGELRHICPFSHRGVFSAEPIPRARPRHRPMSEASNDCVSLALRCLKELTAQV